jgi:CheY-like chemotaxis protein
MLLPILLVEDNPMDVDLTLRAFSRRKLANPVEIARDGEEALAWFEKWDTGAPMPLVVLLDLNLPKVGGLDVLSAFKAHEKYRTIPVVVLTTSKEDKDLQEAYSRGVNSYIVKPVSFEAFMGVAEQIQMYWGALNTPNDANRSY